MAILRASKKAQRLEGLRDNLVDILKPSHATFTGVSLESFANFEENGGGKSGPQCPAEGGAFGRCGAGP